LLRDGTEGHERLLRLTSGRATGEAIPFFGVARPFRIHAGGHLPSPEHRRFQEVATELSPALASYLRRFVGDPILAEDLLQETLLRIEKGLGGFEGRSSLKTWSFTIASRVAADHFRAPENSLYIVDIDSTPEVADLDPSIHERMVVSEMNSCVRQVIDSLPSDFRTALVLHDLEGMSAKEVAAICECSVAAAKIRIHRARARLKKRLERKCDFQYDDGVLRCDRKTS